MSENCDFLRRCNDEGDFFCIYVYYFIYQQHIDDG